MSYGAWLYGEWEISLDMIIRLLTTPSRRLLHLTVMWDHISPQCCITFTHDWGGAAQTYKKAIQQGLNIKNFGELS